MQFVILSSILLCLMGVVFCVPQYMDIFSLEPVRIGHNKIVKRSYFPYELQWEKLKKQYGKQYSPSEEKNRRQIFMETVKQIEAHNQRYIDGKETYYQDINQFSDMTEVEYTAYTSLKMDLNASNCSPFLTASTINQPSHVDWRAKGYVTTVKNQKSCESGWAFSATGALEGQHFKKTQKLLSLSEQQLVDCSGSFEKLGCNGGLPSKAFKYAENFGIESESNYPYTGQDMTCRYQANMVEVKCTGCIAVPQESESSLMKAVATVGPISVAIDANHPSFQVYKGGIYNNPQCSSTRLDHAVLVVGYGSQNGIDYWIVKNSWGMAWGDNGYIYMSRNKGNQCGIATLATYPLV